MLKKAPLAGLLSLMMGSLALSGCHSSNTSIEKTTGHGQNSQAQGGEAVGMLSVNQHNRSIHADTRATADIAEQFAAFSDSFVLALWQVAPTWALYSGFHQYDGVLQIPDAISRQQTLDFVHQQRQLLADFAPESLSASAQTDQRLITNLLDKLEWQIKVFKSWQWDPSQYNVAGGFARIINEDFAPLDTRLRSVLARLAHVPAYYQAARMNITDPTLPHTQLAIAQNQGAFSVLSDELADKVQASGLSDDEKALFQRRLTAAREAITTHIDWLSARYQALQLTGARDFRIGAALYEQKFALDIQAGMTAEQLYQRAMAEKTQVQQSMAELTAKLWPKYFTEPMPKDSKLAIRQMIDHLSERHVAPQNFVSEVRAQIPQLEQFVQQHQLLTLDKDKPLVVRETPAYMRGFAGASISAPGPYEAGGNTYYNVTPLDNMTPAQAESYLREYNHWVLQILNIHEAIPGHYAQLVYSNQAPSRIKSLFGNGAMVEGWAVYTERMMLEQGYGDFEPELWLMYYKWNLRVICNTILDYSVQVLGMEEAEAMALLTQEAFQQQAEASGKWRRAKLSQVQLTSYYAGYRAIYDFREEYRHLIGAAFQLKDFHETFLSFGSAPVNAVRGLMLEKLPANATSQSITQGISAK
ncbi:hypothetical protein NFHSH190041_16170 [Shewanella sp. NFH-SH190041]|nr:DUF885 domain-containing protein [Shewanella sp. NFH-SH190041]BDM64165.1 hypothetical protein NFHSH190041_16170 [Shewanella sp. NFH-SH190041]